MRSRRPRNGRAVPMPINHHVSAVASFSGWQPTTSEWRSARGLACLNSPSIAEDWAPPLIDVSVENFARITLPVFKVGARISIKRMNRSGDGLVGGSSPPTRRQAACTCAYPRLLQHCPRSSVKSTVSSSERARAPEPDLRTVAPLRHSTHTNTHRPLRGVPPGHARASEPDLRTAAAAGPLGGRHPLVHLALPHATQLRPPAGAWVHPWVGGAVPIDDSSQAWSVRSSLPHTTQLRPTAGA